MKQSQKWLVWVLVCSQFLISVPISALTMNEEELFNEPLSEEILPDSTTVPGLPEPPVIPELISHEEEPVEKPQEESSEENEKKIRSQDVTELNSWHLNLTPVAESNDVTIINRQGDYISGIPPIILDRNNLIIAQYQGNNMTQDTIVSDGGKIVRIQNGAKYRGEPITVVFDFTRHIESVGPISFQTTNNKFNPLPGTGSSNRLKLDLWFENRQGEELIGIPAALPVEDDWLSITNTQHYLFEFTNGSAGFLSYTFGDWARNFSARRVGFDLNGNLLSTQSGPSTIYSTLFFITTMERFTFDVGFYLNSDGSLAPGNLALHSFLDSSIPVVFYEPRLIEIEGKETLEELNSRYEISQIVESIDNVDLEIKIESPEVLSLENVHVSVSLSNSDNTDITNYIDLDIAENRLTLILKDQYVKQFRGEELNIELTYPIYKTDLNSFIDSDFAAISIEVSNNLREDKVIGTARTWVRPWGDSVPQEVVQGMSTEELDPTGFIKNIENKLLDDNPFIVGFSEKKIFDTLGESSIGVIIESEISGIQNTIDVPVTVIEGSVPPVDPLDPEVEVIPENQPELPEEGNLLSIDFVSTFNFGSQAISAHDQTYYAQPQRLLNGDGTVNEDEERPNYVQVSDRRSENERNGWQLAVTQRGEFEGLDGQTLAGARLRLMNQQVASAQGGNEPHLQQTNPLTLVPNVRRVLLLAQGDEGTGTWVYRFGNGETAGESIALDVPKGANPEATHYKATLLWELSVVPEN